MTFFPPAYSFPMDENQALSYMYIFTQKNSAAYFPKFWQGKEYFCIV